MLLAAILLRPAIAQAQDLGFSADIGAVGAAGDGTFNATTDAYQIDGAGVGLTGSSDAFHFAYYEGVCGDGQMIVRLVSTDANAQVALVLRESLDANAAAAAASVNNANAQFVRRLATGNNTVAGATSTASAPCWLKVVRSGPTISAFVSPDGQTWTSLGSDTVTLANPTIYVGLAVSNGLANATNTARATFDSLQSTFLPSGGLLLWLKPEAGVTQDANGLVSQWADASGQGNDASAAAGNRPQWVDNVINGHPVLRFDGNSDYLSTSAPVSTATNNATVLAVVRLPDANTQGTFIKNGSPNDGFGLGVGSGTFDSTGNDALALYEGLRWINGGTRWGTGTVLAEMTVDASGNPVMYRNGVLLGNFGGGAPRSATGSTGIGGYGGRCYRGDIAEVVMFNRLLSDGERQAWENYLNAKYQFTPPPAAPTQLRVTPLSTSQATLFWTENSPGVNGYSVERQNADGTWSLIAIVGAGSASYVDGSLAAGNSYAYRVTAFNSAGNSAYSPQASVSTPAAGSAPVSVAAADALTLWLRADAGITQDANNLVRAWADASGHGNDAAQGDPTKQPRAVAAAINGQPVLHFDGSNGYLQLPSGFNNFSQGLTALVVARPTGVNNWQRFFDLGDGENSNNVLLARQGTSDALAFYSNNPSFEVDRAGAIALNTCQLLECSQSANTVTVYKNGLPLASGGGGVLGNVVRTSNFIAKSNWASDALYQGDIAEIVLFNRALTDAERQAWENYLNAKYAVVAPPDAPLALTGSVVSASQANLLWRLAGTGGLPSGFAVERKLTGSADDFVEVAAIAGGMVAAYLDNGLVAGSSYTYRVRAYNPDGYSGYSPEFSVMVPAADNLPASLPAVDALDLWLRADAGITQDAGGLVSIWTDASGHGNDALQPSSSNQPQWVDAAINGHPVLRFGGSGQVLTTAASVVPANQNVTIMTVVGLPDASVAGTFVRNDGFSLGVGNNTLETTGNSAVGAYEYVRWLPTGQTWSTGTVLAAMSVDGSGQPTFYRNGSNLGTLSGNPPTYTTGQTTIGGDPLWSARSLRGDVAEVLVFNRVLTNAERQAWENYLNAKYRFTPPPPAPGTLTVTSLSSSQVALSWSENFSNVASYTVERQNADGTWSVIATLDGRATSYIDSGLTPGAARTYRLTATNAVGSSPAVTATGSPAASSPGAFPSSGLLLWLKADAGVSQDANNLVSIWSDASGHGNDALAAPGHQPLWTSGDINGYPALHFSGSGQVMTTSAAAVSSNQNVTVYTVVKLPDASVAGTFVRNDGFSLGVGSGTLENAGNEAVGLYEYARWIPTGQNWGTGAVLAGLAIDNSGQPTFYRNGVGIASPAGAAPTYTANQTTIGGDPLWPARFLRGDIAEVLVFNRVLTEVERETVEAYLNGKYAVIAAPDAPAALAGSAISASQASLLWQLATTGGMPSGFSVERKLTGGADDFVEVAAIAGDTVAAYIDDGLVAGSSYTYRVRAYTAFGYSDYSPVAIVEIPNAGGLPASLPSVDALTLWLRPEAGVTMDANGLVSAWTDASGHGNNVLQTAAASQPQWVDNAMNGHPVLRFDGDSDVLAAPLPATTATNNVTILAVVGLPDANDHGTFVKDGLAGGFGLGVGSGNFGSSGNAAVGLYENVRWLGDGTPWGTGAVLAEMTVDAAGNPALYRNGTILGNLGGGGLLAASGPTFIGGSNGDNTRFLRGDIAEVVMFERLLTDTERQAWENYLNAKYQFVPTPATPTQLTITPLSSSQIALSWTASTGVVGGYLVERQNADGSWSALATVGANITSYIDGGLAADTAHNYRVLASGSLGNSASSAAVTGSTNPAATPGAFPVAGLQLWLRADRGTLPGAGNGISVWADQSGGSFLASQNDAGCQPVIVPNDVNGQPALRFDGISNYLSTNFTGVGGQELTCIVVASGANYQSLVRFELPGVANYFIYPWQGSSLLIDSADGGPGGGLPSGLVPGQWNLGEAVYKTGDRMATYCNGNLVASRAANGNDLPGGLPLNIGHGAGGGEYLQADVAEVFIYNRVLSDAERQAVEHYCVVRYALPAFLGGDPNADPDGDGLTNYQEYLAGTDPLDYYNGQTPRISIVSGNNQPGTAGALVAQPLQVKVANAAGVPLANAPVAFAVTRANGLLADPAAPATLTSTITVRTDANGIASALFQAPANFLYATSLVSATAGKVGASSQVTFAEAIVGNDNVSGDGLPDWWKLQYGLDLSVNEASGDPDGDGLTNLQEFLLGTNPNVPDLTADGVPYSWVLARGLDPRFDSLDAIDPNGNGLTYLQEYQLQQSTVDLWKFDGGAQSTAVASSTGYKDVGVLFDNPYWTADPDGGAALFFPPQAGAQVDVANVTDGHLDFSASQSFSVTARFQAGDPSTSRLVGKGMGSDGAAGYRVGMDQGQVTAGIGAANVGSPALRLRTLAFFNDGQWHHVAATFDRTASQVCIYVDGILQPVSVDGGSVGISRGTSVTFDPAIVTLSASRPDAVFAIGAQDPSGAESFAGTIDNVGLFSKALTPAEVRSLAGNQGNTPPVVAISSPINGAEFPQSGSITIQVQAFSPTGSISKVECFDGATKLGEASASPYTVAWTQVPAGNHTLIAKATDGRGAAAISAPVSIVVSADSDQDGLPDWWELRYFGNLDQTAAGSYLNDGVSNLTKYQLGLDPTKPITNDANNSTGLVVFTPLR